MGTKHTDLESLVRQRLEESRAQREESRTCIYKRWPLLAEPDKNRALKVAKRIGAESIQDDTVDFLPSWFLTLGAARAKAVCIVRSGRGEALGSGFLISSRLVITNHHVLEDPEAAKSAFIEFNFADDAPPGPPRTTGFFLDPDRFWLANSYENLDFAIVAVGERLGGEAQLSDFGHLPLSDRADKHALGLHANVVQHPFGKPRQVVVRENRFLARDAATQRCLHYSADTAEGSSGSPVFNDAWEVVALHHWGIPYLDTVSVNGIPVPVTVNEGIRISVIVEQLRKDVNTLPPEQAGLLQEALDLGATEGKVEPPVRAPGKPERPEGTRGGRTTKPGACGAGEDTTSRQPASGSAARHILMVPLEVTVRALEGSFQLAHGPRDAGSDPTGLHPSVRFSERIRKDPHYGNRNGFQSDFIDGLSVDLRDLVRPRADDVAPLLDGTTGADAILHYQNFSVVMCGSRRMAFFTATNIDARRYVEIDRDTGEPKVGPEGESWFDDDRMDPAYYIGQSWYSDWSDYFDRGHLTRRTDPTWGTELQAVRANADTYHRTNCSPQHFRFNQSIRYWQGLERYVLEFGVLPSKERLTVLTGPLLDDYASQCDDVAVPLSFWKVLLRTDKDGTPKASAFLVSQEALLDEPRRYVRRASDTQVPKVDPFRCALSKLAEMTGLDFSAFARYDTFRKRKGSESTDTGLHRVADWGDVL